MVLDTNPIAQTRAEYLIQQINANNAKKIAVILVIGFIAYHGLIHLQYGLYYLVINPLCFITTYFYLKKPPGKDSCKWLMTNGRFKGDKEWQPYGCMMHKYTQM